MSRYSQECTFRHFVLDGLYKSKFYLKKLKRWDGRNAGVPVFELRGCGFESGPHLRLSSADLFAYVLKFLL